MSFFIASLVVLLVILGVELHYLLKDRRDSREIVRQIAELHAELRKLLPQGSVEQKTEISTEKTETSQASTKKPRKYRKKNKATLPK